MSEPLTETLFNKLLNDVNEFINNNINTTKNKTFIKSLDELVAIVNDCKADLTQWKSHSIVLLAKLSQIYQSIHYDRWFHAYGKAVALRDSLEHIFEDTLGIKPEIGYFSTNLMPVWDLDIAVDNYVEKLGAAN